MNRPVTIVVLAKYKEIFQPFVETVEKFYPDLPKVLVADGQEPLELVAGKDNWKVVMGPEEFSMAGNGNLGLTAVDQNSDVLYCGDDIRFLSEQSIPTLQEVAYLDERIGILSPRLIGRGSPMLVNPPADAPTDVRPIEMWFPCVYIKRDLIMKIGYLDEDFNKFGSDDVDYCIRTMQAGYRLCVTAAATVLHQAAPEGGPTTFDRAVGGETRRNQEIQSFEKLRKKYAVSYESLNRFLATGDLSSLKSTISKKWDGGEVTEENAREFLKTRSLYIATPAYGGWFSINYVESLLAISNICKDLGIQLKVSFMYNESLITRARNKLADDFLKNTDFTDFVFIDADIGMDGREIIGLLIQNMAPVLGVPCARKNLRLDRVQHAIKAHPDKQFSIEEMQEILGEFVINFPPNAGPQKLNMGKPIPVQDVGTGVVRIQREVFLKIQETFPDRYYLPMRGEQDDQEATPLYMFFQCDLSQDSRQFNPGNLPHYISEDYYFCRSCAAAGIQIYAAPWVRTTHMGSYMYRGNMVAVAQVGGSLR